MKKLFFTFIALLIVFFSAWGIKLRMPINRPNNVQGEQQVAWYETRYTAPTAEEEWTLDPEIPVNYLPVAGEDEVYMVLDDSGNIVGYRHRTQQEDGSWLWTDIEDPNAEHYEKVDGLDHIYKVTDKDGTSSYQQYVRNEDGSYAYVPVNENGVPLDDGADATTIDTTHYVHKSGNVYGLYNDNGVLTGYRERVKDGENYVWKVTDPPKSSTSDLQEWSEAKKDNANQGDLSADSGDGTQNSGNNGVIVGGSGAESSQIDNGDGTYLISKPDDVILDLGAVAKGYIADKIKDFLEENGVKRAIINLGGNVLCIGKKTNTDNFGIGVRKPFAANNEVLVALSVDDSSVVSSGNYERYFYADDGTFYHHILNPATGYSYDNDLSDVTILSKDSLTGDCLSTTCFCLGLDDGMKLIESLDGIEAVFVTNEGEIHYSSGAKAYVKS